MWYAGAAKDFQSRDRPAARPPQQRSQSQTALRPRMAGDRQSDGLGPRGVARGESSALRSTAAHGGAAAPGGGTWQRGAAMRGTRSGSGRAIGKSPSANAVALLTLSSTSDLGFEAADAAQAKEMLRIGAWSVRRAPGGPDSGLLYVNVETGRAQREAPQEVCDELFVDEEEPEQDLGASLPSIGGGSHSAVSSTSRPGTGAHRSSTGSRPGTSGSRGVRPSSPPCPAKFQRILLGNRQDLPLAMARDIHAALVEDSDLFEQLRERFSDAPLDEGLLDLDGLYDELETVAAALAPGQLSDVIATEAGMQILLRVS